MRSVSPSSKSSARIHRMLITTGLLVPAALFVAAAWRSKADIEREGAATLLSAVAVLEDSLRGRLQTEEVALTAVAEHVRGLDWDAIATPETVAYLRGLLPSADQIAVISIADRDGTVRATSGATTEPGPSTNNRSSGSTAVRISTSASPTPGARRSRSRWP